MRELELKFEVDDSFEVPASWPGVTRVLELPALELRARYFDTDDLALIRHGITLRHRTGDESGPIWTLKLPVDGDGAERDELESDAPPRRPPESLTDVVRVFTSPNELRPLATIKTRRRRWALEDETGAGLAEVALDDVVVMKERKITDRWRELELESKGATRDRLESIAGGLIGAGATRGAQTSKGARALGWDGGLLTQPSVAKIAPTEPAAATVRNAIVTALNRLEKNDPRARLEEAEGVHQLRVAARHLRSDLKTFASLVEPKWARALGRELKWLGTLLGEVRDLDVLQLKLRAAATGLESELAPLFEELQERTKRARTRALEGLDSDRYASLVGALRDAVDDSRPTPAAQRPGGEVLPPLVATRWNALSEAVERLGGDAPPERWHEARILAKRARYAAEAVAFSLGAKAGKDAASFARLCSKVQDVLGDQQDAFVAIETVKNFAEERSEDGRLNRAAGRVLERQVAKAHSSRQAFWKQWRRIDRKKNLKWLTRKADR